MKFFLTTLACLFMTINFAGAETLDSVSAEEMSAVVKRELTAITIAKKTEAAHSAAFVISNGDRRWEAGQTITVAFKGGNLELYKDIEEAAKNWEKIANIVFSFKNGSSYRTWSEKDVGYLAQIRISFDKLGYYSAIGTDSINPHPDWYPPGKSSMNFQNFDVLWPGAKPYSWKSDVMHEFGHALGFWHEHQKPVYDREIDYELAIEFYKKTQKWDAQYTLLQLKPRTDVEFFPGESEICDLASLMKYQISEKILKKGRKSKCFTEIKATDFSARDRAAARLYYPRDSKVEFRLSKRQSLNAEAAAAITENNNITEEEAKAGRQILEARNNAAQPLVYFQIASDSQRSSFIRAAAKLRIEGFIVPAVEIVGDNRSPRNYQVRFFLEADRAAAAKVADSISQDLGRRVVSQLFRGYEKSVRRPTIEVWYAKS